MQFFCVAAGMRMLMMKLVFVAAADDDDDGLGHQNGSVPIFTGCVVHLFQLVSKPGGRQRIK